MSKKILVTARFVVLLIVATQCQYCAVDTEWHEENGYRWAKLAVPRSGKTGFKQLSESETGITFTNNLTKEQIAGNRVLLNGSGVAMGDIDGDGLTDIFFARLNGPNVLYKNLGNWKFLDITDSAGVACPDQFSGGAAFVDIDGDADLDLLVTSLEGPNACFLNNGSGKFTDVTETSGISSKTGASSMTFADIDGDNDLDLYITNYKKKSAKDIWEPGALLFDFVVEKVGDSHRIAPKYQDHFVIDIREQWVLFFETGEPDMLFLNDGQGHFEKDSLRFLDENGNPISELKDWGLMVRFQDMDDDGDPDIYVCNDFESPDRIWINDGQGRFRAMPKLAIRNTSNSSMAIDFSDIDRDGDLDFMVVDMLSLNHRRRMTQKNTQVPLPHPIGEVGNRPQYMKNTLFLNRGDNTYAEIAQFSNIHASEWSWSNLFLDVDLDGFEDLLVATGHYYDAQDQDAILKANSRLRMSAMTAIIRSKTSVAPEKNDILTTIFLFPRLELPNIAFRNRGDLTFEEVSRKWGFNSVDISHGMALGDLDNDGDLDVVMNRLDKPAGVYRNESTAARIAVRLRGLAPNTQGIGAKIRVLGGPVPQSKEVISAGTYLSSSDPLSVFAAGNAQNLTIEVKWRNGNTSTINDVKPNRIYEIYETDTSHPGASIDKQTAESSPKPFFEDVSHLIKHKHHESTFNDFKRQPLLPNRLSQLGPGVTWYDIDADGDDDLLISSGKGGQLVCFRNDREAGFSQINDPIFTKKTHHEQTAVIGLTYNDATVLLVGNSNFENSEAGNSFISSYKFTNGRLSLNQQISAGESSVGPIAMADYDGDGDLDLFIGGRTIPGRYPEPASSRLYFNENGIFKVDSLNTQNLQKVGLVSGAVFSDIDSDGDVDLVLALEWGPVKVFQNRKGRFTDITKELGLDRYHGWWHGVTTGDLNEDGKLDIIATNWGLNSKYENRYEEGYPLQLFYSDFDNNGTLDIVETYFYLDKKTILPQRPLLSMLRAMPHLAMRIPDNKKYGRSSVPEIIGPKLNKAGKLKANTLAHMVFLNRGDHFEAVEMPTEAQFAPAFYVGVADFDGDGHEDVFISQNFFASHHETPRSDAGRGLWMQGDGSGDLAAIPGQRSGIKVYGEQRGAALGDFDHDGRIDLAISQNGAATKLYRNVGAKPGLRIRLAGTEANPNGVGATIRLVYEDGFGPAREIHLGSGYWSQDSMVQVMGIREPLKGIQVCWPGGKITESEIPRNAEKITIDLNGNVVVE
ncbi:MAG: hypothetical protein E2O76_18520 [Caldithrix sp.]|nr:MAG: hypothetical protein E2O76_18520 [Caldithrix sp.]